MAKTPASQVSSPRTRSREHANSGQKSADTGQQKRSLRAKPSGSQEPRSPKSPRSGSKPSKQQQASKELQETPPSVEPRSSNTDSPLDPSIKEEADNASATKSSANKSGGQRKRQRKAPSAAEAQREAETAQKEAEDEILAKAKAIRRIRYQKSWQASAEPKREKEHWDFLIDEMQWMAKEFARERKWKTAQAKRLVRKTAASEKNLELRESARQREEKQQLKRKALFLGKEVAKFWAKAERLVVYKAKSIAEAKKKEIMDKHLSFLVGQTQRYSSMLAKRLHQDGDEEEFKPEQKPEAEEQAVTQSASPAEPDKSKGARGVEEAQVGEDRDAWGTSIGDGDIDDGEEFEAGSDSGADDEATLEEEMDLAKDEEDETAIEVQDLQDEADMPIEQLLARYGRGPSSSAPITEPPAVQTPPEPAEESDQPPAEPPAGEGAAGDEEYEEEEGGEDIEDTLDQEDRLAAQDGTDAKLEQSAELAALNAEAEMPLEELMAMYRNARSEHDDSSDEDIEIPAGPQQDTSWAQDLVLPDSSQPVGFLAKDKPIESKPAGPVQQPNALEELPIATTTDKPSPSVTQETPVEGDEEYEEEEGGEDIEDTLDQEDRLAAQDGTDAKAEQSAELAALNAEAEMPLEELMAMYRNRPSPEHSDSSDEDTMSVDLPSGLPRDTSWAQDLVLPGPSQPAEDQKPLLPGSEKDESRKEDLSPEADELIPDHQTLTSGVSDPEKDDSKVEEQEPEDTETEDAERKGGSKEELVDAAQLAAEAQPTGYTFETTSVSTKAPFLLKHTMREYQHIGLDWLVTIYTRRLNGILADEMGLGKTIQTIALLAYLACEKGIWGPHLIVVPTSVMLNWEMECKKWCPAFKLMTYYGSAKERKLKRQGWSKPNAFHICITSYTIVLQDAKMFRRKKWKYLILDEAHMIKNWKSQRWQTLLNFNSARRLLITGTPLQNDLMELWSLMHFLMPQVFASHAQFKDWFSNPLTGMVEGSEGINKALVERLHSVLRPFLLRRLKSEVEKQMPGKHEHVIKCRLSKRQRTLYEDYMASSDTRNTLSSGNYLGIMNVLMSLRKVCNHPDLFEGRSIVSAFDCPRVEVQVPSVALTACAKDVWRDVNPGQLGFEIANDTSTPLWAAQRIQELTPELHEYEQLPMPPPDPLTGGLPFVRRSLQSTLPFQASAKSLQIVASVKAQLQMSRMEEAGRRAAFNATLSHARSTRLPHCGPDMVERLTIRRDANKVRLLSSQPSRYFEYTNCLRDMVVLPEERADAMEEEIETFVFAIPKARANSPQIWCSHPDQSEEAVRETEAEQLRLECQSKNQLLHKSDIRQKLFFPDRRLVQFDCGKLQELAVLLHQLKAGGHKALIFTQMTKMLDILEVFLNLNNHAYVRLDGSTKPEQRQILMQRFNTNPKLFVFILSTRSGGVGMNLTGADTVIFYDSDWNPAMDAQAQDRCHRIGQTREVHIYRLVSEKTIEENILIKSDQKRHLDHLAIQSGGFNTDFLQKFNPQDLLSLQGGQTNDAEIRAAMRNAEDENDAAAANLAEEETAAELAEFTAEPPAPLPDPDDANSNAAGTGNKEEGLSDEMKQAKVEADETKALADELGVETGNQDSLTALEQALKPIERYAVKWVEQVRMSEGLYDVDANAAVAQQQVDTQEWNMQEIERQKRIQEEEAEEEGEVERMAEWDKKAADEAYRIEVERAQQQQKLLEEQLLAEQLALEKAQAEALEAAQEAAAAELSRQNKRKRSEDLQEEALSPHKDWQPSTSRRGRQIQRPSRHGDVEISSDDDDDIYYRSHKQARTTARQRAVMEQKQHRSSHEIANGHKNTQSQRLVKVWVPWEPSEDLVLCAVVAWSLSNPSTPQDTTAASQPAAGSNQGDLTPQSQQSGQHTNSINGRPGDPQTTNGGLEDSKPQEDTVADKETMILPAIWQSASNALTCGSSALTPTAANTAFQARSRRSPMACKARYNMLLKAHKAAISNSGSSGPQSGILSKLLVVLKVHTELSAQELLEMMTKARQVHESTGNTVALSPSTMKLLEKFQNLQASVPPPGSDGLEPEALFTVVSLERANAVLAAVSKACSPTAEAIQANLRRVLGSLSGSTLKEVHLAHLARLQPAPPPSLPPPAAPTQPAAAPQYSALPGAAAAAYPIFRPSPPSSGNAASLPKANFQRGHGLESSQGHGTFSSRIGPTEMMRPAVITAPSLNAKGAPQQNKTAKPGQRRGSERISVTMQPQMLAGWSQHPTMGSFPAASPVAYPSATGAYPAGSTVAYPSAPAGGYPAGSAGVYPVGNQGAYPPAFQLYPRLPVTSMAGSLPSSLPFSQIQPFFSGALMPPPRLPGFWQQFPIPGFPSTTAASPQPQPGQNQGSAALSVPASGVQSTQLLPGNAAASMPDWLQQRLQQVPTPMPFPTSLAQPPPSQTAGNLPSQAAGNQSSTQTGPSQPQSQNPIS